MTMRLAHWCWCASLVITAAAWSQPAGTGLEGLWVAHAPAFHPDLLVVAQPGGTLVREDRARRDRPRHLHLHHDLKRKLMRYIRHYNQAPKTVKWKYFD